MDMINPAFRDRLNRTILEHKVVECSDIEDSEHQLTIRTEANEIKFALKFKLQNIRTSEITALLQRSVKLNEHSVIDQGLKTVTVSTDKKDMAQNYVIYHFLMCVLPENSTLREKIKEAFLEKFVCDAVLLDIFSRNRMLSDELEQIDITKLVALNEKNLVWLYYMRTPTLFSFTPLSSKILEINIRRDGENKFTFSIKFHPSFIQAHAEKISAMIKPANETTPALFYLKGNELGFVNYYGNQAEVAVFISLIHKIEPLPSKMLSFLKEKLNLQIVIPQPVQSLKEMVVRQIFSDPTLIKGVFGQNSPYNDLRYEVKREMYDQLRQPITFEENSF